MAKPKNQKPPFALRALAAFAVTLAALFVLLLAAYALPGEPVRDHVYDSAVKIAGEGLYPEYLNFKLFQMDNYTDTIMLTEAASADEAPPLTAMMTNTAYNVDNFETLADDLQWYIERDWATGAQRTDAPALVPVLLRAVLARLPDLAAPAAAGHRHHRRARGAVSGAGGAVCRGGGAAAPPLRAAGRGVVRGQSAAGHGVLGTASGTVFHLLCRCLRGLRLGAGQAPPQR